jgi:hypothetical protein
VFTWLAVLTVWAVPGAAHGQPAGLQISGGYAFVLDEMTDLSLPAGWMAGVAGPITPWLAWAGEVGANYKTTSAAGSDLRFAAHTFLGGLRVSGRTGRVTEFGQVLAGALRATASAFDVTSAHVAAAVQAGAGVDVALAGSTAIRLELDYRFTVGGEDVEEPARQLRGVVAAVYTWR